MSAQTVEIKVGRAEEIVSFDPATGEEVGRAPAASAAEVSAAVGRAREAQKAWGALSYEERARVIMRARRVVLDELEEIALLISRETGKPVAEAVSMELAPTLDLMQFFARRTRRLLRPEKIDIGQYGLMGRTSRIVYRPLGVVGVISPWNFPWATPLDEVVMALMAGNSVVVKPSELTPLSALAMARVCQLAGVPDGLVNVVCGEGRVVGRQLVEHPLTSMVTLTGSTRAGQEILAQAAGKVMAVSLELGGKAPVIVFPDADLDLAVGKAFEARFWNCGQVCTCNERTYVHASLHDEFVGRFAELARGIRIGDPAADDTELGPKVSAAEWDKVKGLVDGAVAAGAKVVLGGDRPEGGRFTRGHWFAPTVLTGVSNDMEVVQREVFGPVLPVLPFDGYDEVIAWANSTDYGLTSYVFTEDLRTAMRASDDLEFGEVYVNAVGPEQFQAFHSGWKLSGLGGDDGRHGYDRYVRRKTVYLRYGG